MDQFLAEIRIFPFNFPPTGWAFCDGQLIPIAQNTALFSVVGTYYGGDGTSTFALPDLRGAVPMDAGQGPGLSLREIGNRGGASTHQLLPAEIPAHGHSLGVFGDPGSNTKTPGTGQTLSQSQGNSAYVPGTSPADRQLDSSAITTVGGGNPHNNMQPYLTLNFCIALQGVYPNRA